MRGAARLCFSSNRPLIFQDVMLNITSSRPPRAAQEVTVPFSSNENWDSRRTITLAAVAEDPARNSGLPSR